jgi:hypothetical protein
MHVRTRVALAAMAAAALGLGAATAAQADPANAKNSLPITITCDNGTTYHAVTNGNGHWTPAHDLNSQTTLVPLSFGTQTFTVLDPAGNVVDQESTPPVAKTAVDSNKNATISCTFTGSMTQPDGSMFVLTGSVVGFATPNS